MDHKIPYHTYSRQSIDLVLLLKSSRNATLFFHIKVVIKIKLKKNIIRSIICISVISTGIHLYNCEKYMSDSEKDEMYRMKTLSERTLKQHEKQLHMNKRIEDKQKEIVEFLNSEEYNQRETTRYWRQQLGITIDDITPVTFKTTAYSSLQEENGGYNVTCNNKPLKGNIVANNSLPQGSKILLGDKIYTVADRGSSRFDNPTRLDVLLERESYESDSEYKKRVSEYGVKNIKGYIINVDN